MKHLKVNALIATISLITALFSCSLNAMTVVQPKGTLSMQKRQAMLTNLRKAKINPFTPTIEKLPKEYSGFDDISSCKENEFFIHGKESHSGVCVSPEVVQLCGTLDVKTDKKVMLIPDFSSSVIKNTFDILKKYAVVQHRSEDVIKRQINQAISSYSQDQLVDVINCIYYLDCPIDLQNVCFDEVKNKYKGNIRSVIANKKLNPDVRQLFLIEPATRCLTNLLQKKNVQTTKKNFRNPKNPNLRNIAVERRMHTSVAFSADGKKVVEGLGHSFVVRDSATGTILLERNLRRPVEQAVLIEQAVLSPNGNIVIVGNDHGQLDAWDIATGNHIGGLFGTARGSSISSLAFSHDGTKVVAACQSRVIIWSTATMTQIFHIDGHEYPVSSVAFNKDDTAIVVGYTNTNNTRTSNIQIWDAINGSTIKAFKVPSAYISSVSFSPDGKKILYVGAKPYEFLQPYLLDIATETDTPLTPDQSLFFNDEMNVRQALFINDGKKIIISKSMTRGDICILDIDDNDKVIQKTCINLGMGPMRSMAISPNNRKIMLGYEHLSALGNYGSALIECTLWTDDDDAIINQLKNCDSDELELILDKCSEGNDGSVKELVGAEAETFQSLPQDIKQVLSDLFWPEKPKQKSWFSGWW